MHLILWRHAEAADGVPDLKRQLTDKGRKQAREMAAWLQTRLAEDFRVIASPAERALQTASALTDDFRVVESIAPGASWRAVLEAAGWPHSEHTVVVVGHQPVLGQTAAKLLTGKALPWTIKKGAVWWLTHRERDGQAQVVLRAVISPDLLKQ